jgi:hypothetical protein
MYLITLEGVALEGRPRDSGLKGVFPNCVIHVAGAVGETVGFSDLVEHQFGHRLEG